MTPAPGRADGDGGRAEVGGVEQRGRARQSAAPTPRRTGRDGVQGTVSGTGARPGPGAGSGTGPGAGSGIAAGASRAADSAAATADGTGSGASGRVPEQTRTEAGGDTRRAVRGEHTHSEPPAPRVVRRHSVRGQILDALRSALVVGELVPGEVYSAPVLGERFGVSATPVREAMQQLALEGAVEVVPNRGFRVVERGARELAELAEVRALIEVPVMLRLARTVPAERWAELRPLAEATATAAAVGDRAAYAESDRAFHRALLSLCGNEQLVMVADDLHRRSQWPLVSAPAVRRADLVADAAEHSALLDALETRDLTVIQSLVREHFAGAPD
ncbi:GntR family transcriptional regulator [Streptomyces sp. NBC_00872]|uniref:GntR family transcriptional regulator n=1 Tax=Streptomyces sp. NBC_00872 TaxID=2903686 RepID=UPI00386613B2|nr:GntR family transcriptional regulator [Streptomyces sp. NBC_00872]